MSVFPRRKSKTWSSPNFLQSGPRKFSKSDFSGLAPIRRVLIFRPDSKISAESGIRARNRARDTCEVWWEVLPPELQVISFGLEGVCSRVCKLGALSKARLKKVHFSGDFLGAFDFLRSACSL